jgi:hypothetical protein
MTIQQMVEIPVLHPGIRDSVYSQVISFLSSYLLPVP